MKKILIGTHNAGKFREIAYLISKKYKKISPITLRIKSPKETGKSFISNSRLKVKFFSNYVNFPVISDDSGLCIKALNNKPGIYSARLAKKQGSFFKAMKLILKKLEDKKNRKVENSPPGQQGGEEEKAADQEWPFPNRRGATCHGNNDRRCPCTKLHGARNAPEGAWARIGVRRSHCNQLTQRPALG